ncbi:MAG: hypothetical protein WDZ39_00530 [Candidatus Spechtbacterales bacterium]
MPTIKGKFIVIEGSDGTGKETQSKLLAKKLLAERISFPDYDSKEGKIIRKYLNGEFGNVKDVGPYDIAPVYGMDRFAHKEQIEKVLSSGTHLISDRYFDSNAAYQGAKIKNEEARKEFYRHLVSFEYRILGIHLPDIVVNLRLDGDIAEKHLSERDQFDIHEQSAGYLELVRVEYDRIASEYYGDIFPGRRVVVDCSEGGKQLPIEEISNRIHKYIEKLF